MNKIAPYAKTIVAILGAVLTAVMTQFPDNEQVQTWGPIAAALLTAIAVYAVPNTDPLATHQDESVQPPDYNGHLYRDEAGESYVGLAVGVLLVVILVVVLFRLL